MKAWLTVGTRFSMSIARNFTQYEVVEIVRAASVHDDMIWFKGVEPYEGTLQNRKRSEIDFVVLRSSENKPVEELLDYLRTQLGAAEIKAAIEGLHRPKEEADEIWNNMVQATAVLRAQIESLVDTISKARSFDIVCEIASNQP